MEIKEIFEIGGSSDWISELKMETILSDSLYGSLDTCFAFISETNCGISCIGFRKFCILPLLLN